MKNTSNGIASKKFSSAYKIRSFLKNPIEDGKLCGTSKERKGKKITRKSSVQIYLLTLKPPYAYITIYLKIKKNKLNIYLQFIVIHHKFLKIRQSAMSIQYQCKLTRNYWLQINLRYNKPLWIKKYFFVEPPFSF